MTDSLKILALSMHEHEHKECCIQAIRLPFSERKVGREGIVTALLEVTTLPATACEARSFEAKEIFYVHCISYDERVAFACIVIQRPMFHKDGSNTGNKAVIAICSFRPSDIARKRTTNNDWVASTGSVIGCMNGMQTAAAASSAHHCSICGGYGT
jgi:hypothetical protein